MKINSISSESNSTLKTIRSLHRRQNREKERLFLLEGPHCLGEALKKQLDLKAIVASKSYLDLAGEELRSLDISEISVVDDTIFSGLATTSTSCGVLAIASMPQEDRAALSSWHPRVFAVADSIQDPGNLGTLLRTAYAAELGGVLLLKGSVDKYNPKVVRAAAGAIFDLPVISDLEVQEAVSLIRSLDMRLLICEAGNHTPYYEHDLSNNAALVLGNEGRGTSALLKEEAAGMISIPMNPNSESLNVAISGGIILFESLRQRKKLAKSSR